MIAAIPIGLPTVLSVTMAVGAKQLAAKDVIVKRLPAIEELASVSILCSDKTGTLTLNQLTFDAPFLPKDKSGEELFSKQELLRYAYLASETGANDAIEKAVRKAAEEDCDELKDKKAAESEGGSSSHRFPGYTVKAFIPFDPSTKYT
jgi:H+-transporting ATPase